MSLWGKYQNNHHPNHHLSNSIYIYICVCMCIYIYVCVYIYIISPNNIAMVTIIAKQPRL